VSANLRAIPRGFFLRPVVEVGTLYNEPTRDAATQAFARSWFFSTVKAEHLISLLSGALSKFRLLPLYDRLKGGAALKVGVSAPSSVRVGKVPRTSIEISIRNGEDINISS
jgi:hypothetical protein